MRVSITGVPGTGKTTISEFVGKALGMKVIHLTDLARKEGYLGRYDSQRACRDVDLDKLKKRVQKEDNVVFESHFAEQVPADVVVVLRLDPYEIVERLQNRRYSKKKAFENALAEALDYYATEAVPAAEKVVQVDTTGLTPYEIVDKVIKAVKRGKGDTVDFSPWIRDNHKTIEKLGL